MIAQLKEVKKEYAKFNLDCSLCIEEGRVVGLIGQNGAGKTTVFKSLLNLIYPDGGEASIFGKRSDQLTPADKEEIGVVLAEAGFNEAMTVKDISRVMRQFYSRFSLAGFEQQCVDKKLPLDKPISSFSTGMRAKLKVLMAMSHGAKFLLLDEPTAGLDIVAREELLEILRDFMEDESHAILISSHISGDLESICDEVYMIHEGKIVLHEETDEILGRYALIKADERQFEKLDRKHLIRYRKESFGVSCLTDQKQFYMENYPGLVIEKGSLDEVITIMVKGEAIC